MECKVIRERLSAYLEGAVSPEEKRLIGGHLPACKSCSAALEDLRKTEFLVKGLEKVEPPAWLKQKVMARIRVEQEARKSIIEKLFYPLHVKIPIEAFATILIAMVAIYIFKAVTPEMKHIPSLSPGPVALAPAEKAIPKKDLSPSEKGDPARYVKEKEKDAKEEKKSVVAVAREGESKAETTKPFPGKPPSEDMLPKKEDEALKLPSGTFALAPAEKAVPKKDLSPGDMEELPRSVARVAVSRFEDKSAKGKSTGQIGDGMAEMLANALFASNRFIVLERQSLGDVLQKQDFGASGRVKTAAAPRIGEIEGADLIIIGTITEFEPGKAGAAGGVGGITPVPGRRLGVGGIAAGMRTSHVAMIVKVIDAKTSRILASEQVEGKATDIGGVTGMGGGGLAGVFGGYSNTPMEKAMRVAIEEAVRVIVAKTPPEYFRGSQTLRPQPVIAAPATVPTQGQQIPAPPSPSMHTPGPAPRILYVKWPTVSLREGPGLDFKILMEIEKGTGLSVLEEKGPWIRIRLEDGREGWIGKATTSEIP